MILLVYGTRPEFIKIKPIIDEFRHKEIDFKVLSTGQHKDIVDSHDHIQLSWTVDDSNRLDYIFKNCMSIPNEVFDGVDYVMVQGDTSSAAAVALTAFHNKIKVIHLEAGLRTYDSQNPYPEEINRRLISSIADIHFCPTSGNAQNLRYENVNGLIYIVGNTAIDNLIDLKKDCSYDNIVLVTLHRRENHEKMAEWFTIINGMAKKSPNTFILPLHPNPEVSKHRDLLPDVKVIDPLPHDELLSILIKSKVVITDSGGIQEECSFFNKRCLVCRKATERPESLFTSSMLVTEPAELSSSYSYAIYDYQFKTVCPYGDGHTAKKISLILKETK